MRAAFTARSHLLITITTERFGLLRVIRDLRVALRHALLAIDHQQRHVAALQSAPRHHHAKFFRHQRSFTFSPDARGIHEAVSVIFAHHFGVHVIHRRPRNRRNDGAFLARQPIQQRGFAHVRPPDDRHLNDVGPLFFFDGFNHFDLRQRRVQQIVNSRAMFRRDGKYRHAHGMKRAQYLLPANAHPLCWRQSQMVCR